MINIYVLENLTLGTINTSNSITDKHLFWGMLDNSETTVALEPARTFLRVRRLSGDKLSTPGRSNNITSESQSSGRWFVCTFNTAKSILYNTVQK